MKRIPVLYYQDYEPLLLYLAKIVKDSYPRLEMDDLLSVGRLAMMEATYDWDPKKGKFSTLLYHNAFGRMRQYRREEMRCLTTEKEPEQDTGYTQLDHMVLLEKIACSKYLTNEAVQVIKIIFETPGELYGLTESGIKRYLHLVHKWNLFKVQKAVRALKRFVMEEL